MRLGVGKCASFNLIGQSKKRRVAKTHVSAEHKTGSLALRSSFGANCTTQKLCHSHLHYQQRRLLASLQDYSRSPSELQWTGQSCRRDGHLSTLVTPPHLTSPHLHHRVLKVAWVFKVVWVFKVFISGLQGCCHLHFIFTVV